MLAFPVTLFASSSGQGGPGGGTSGTPGGTSFTPTTSTAYGPANSHSLTVPGGITIMGFRIWGAGGGGSNTAKGGGGGYVYGEFSVTPGDTVSIYPGTAGTYGALGGSGGGRSYVYITGAEIGAGGGGGAAVAGTAASGTVTTTSTDGSAGSGSSPGTGGNSDITGGGAYAFAVSASDDVPYNNSSATPYAAGGAIGGDGTDGLIVVLY